MGFSEKVKEIIEKQGLTQSELASKMGVSRQSISSALKQAKPHAKTIEAFAKALGVTTSELIESDEENNINVQFAERLKKMMEKYGVSGTDLAERTGIAQPVLNGILLGKFSPSMIIIASIMKIFPWVSMEWVLHGSGSMNEIWKSPEGLAIRKDIKSRNLLPSEAGQLQNFRVIGEDDLGIVQKIDATEFRRIDDDLNMVLCPLVDRYAQKIYIEKHGSADYLARLPRHAITVEKYQLGEYLAFEVTEEDNTIEAANGKKPLPPRDHIYVGDIITGRRLDHTHPNFWASTQKYSGLIIVTKSRILTSRTSAQYVREGLRTFSLFKYIEGEIGMVFEESDILEVHEMIHLSRSL